MTHTKPAPAAPQHELLARKSLLRSLVGADWLYAALILAAAAFAQYALRQRMDAY